MSTPDNLLKVERHNHIRKLVEQTGRVTVSELSDQFQVSEATIRRDLEEMDGQGWVQRTHGGALRIERASKEPPIPSPIHWLVQPRPLVPDIVGFDPCLPTGIELDPQVPVLDIGPFRNIVSEVVVVFAQVPFNQ